MAHREDIVLRSELQDQIEDLDRKVRSHTLTLASYAAAAVFFMVLGVVYGTPGYIMGCFLALVALVPLTRRMMASDERRKLSNQLKRLGDPGNPALPP